MGTAVTRLPLRGQSSQCPAPLPTCGAHTAKGAASTWTPLGFRTVAGTPVCPQPCKVTQAVSHPPELLVWATLCSLTFTWKQESRLRAGLMESFRGCEGGIPGPPIPEYCGPTPSLPGLLTFLPGDFGGCRDRAQGLWNAWGHFSLLPALCCSGPWRQLLMRPR